MPPFAHFCEVHAELALDLVSKVLRSVIAKHAASMELTGMSGTDCTDYCWQDKNCLHITYQLESVGSIVIITWHVLSRIASQWYESNMLALHLNSS